MTNDGNDDFSDSYLGKLRKKIGHDLVHVPGAGIVIEKFSGQILLQKRRDFGVWDIPGGSPENGEDTVEQAVRETYEETGLRAINPVPYGFASHPKTQVICYPNGDLCHFHDLIFFATEYEGNLIESNAETLAVDWFYPQDLPKVTAACTLNILAFLKFKKTGVFQII
jgi:8-oxo-dGTP pyrophosphatase MutT (NUDIX family)